MIVCLSYERSCLTRFLVASLNRVPEMQKRIAVKQADKSMARISSMCARCFLCLVCAPAVRDSVRCSVLCTDVQMCVDSVYVSSGVGLESPPHIFTEDVHSQR